MTLTTLTATQFIASVDSASARIALVNRDGYPVAQYIFADVEEAKEFYTEARPSPGWCTSTAARALPRSRPW